jgi:hypothetical protein
MCYSFQVVWFLMLSIEGGFATSMLDEIERNLPSCSESSGGNIVSVNNRSHLLIREEMYLQEL